MYNFDKRADYIKGNISITVKIYKSESYGCFEYEQEQTDEEKEMFGEQESIYFEGGLWFEKDQLFDYDGVDELPEEIIEMIHKLGYKTDNIFKKEKECH